MIARIDARIDALEEALDVLREEGERDAEIAAIEERITYLTESRNTLSYEQGTDNDDT